MSMIGEIHAEMTAKKLEEIILKAINDSKYGDNRSAIKGFVSEELIEWYYDECGETWGSHPAHPEIKKLFPVKNK